MTSNSNDGGSGVASAQFQRSPAGAGTWTNIGAADTTSPYSVNWDTTAVADGLYDLRVITTDNVGNTFTSALVTNVRVDNTLPTNVLSLQSVSPAGSAFQNGNTIYYRGTAAGNFQVQNAVADPGSGPASGIFPALGGTVGTWSHTTQTVNTPAGGPYVTTNNFAWNAGESNTPTESATGTDAAGNTSNATVLSFTNDSTNPTGAITAPASSANVRGSSVTVSSNSNDGGSGVASAQFQRSPAGAGTWTNIGATDTTSPYSANWDTTAVSDGLYDLRVITTDNVGNTFTSALVTNVTVDNTGPTNALSLSSVTPSGSAFQIGNTVYYRGTAAGNLQLLNAVSDAGSGPASSVFPALGGTVGSWTHTTQTVNTPAGGPYVTTNNFAWSAAETNSPTESVTSTDTAGNTSSATVLTFVNDSTTPSVTAPIVGAGYYTSLSVPVTLSGGSDGGSGIAAGSSVVQRDEATLSGGSCGSFSGSWTTITLAAGNDTTVQNGKCYEYRERLTDNVGNVGSSSPSSIAKVDNAGPSNALTLTSISPAGSALKSGSTIYYRGAQTGGGSFKIRNAVSDPESGAASSQTAALGGSSTGWTHTASTVATPAGGPFDSNDFTWAQGTTSAPTEVVTGRDGATNATPSATLTFTNDANDPTGGALTVNGTVASGGGSSSYDSDGNFTIGTRTDYTETQSATESGLASSTLVRTSATFSSPDVCGAFGSPTTIVGNPNQNGLTTGCYRYTLTGTDNVGNAVSIQTTVKVDTSDPAAPTLTFGALGGGAYYPGSGTRVYFKPDAATGTFDLTASSSDADTGIASYSFPAGSALGTNWSGSGSGATRTYSYTATATTNGSQNVSATNNAGRSTSSSFVPTADSTAPTGGALTVNGTVASGGGSSSYDSDGNFTIGTRTDYTETQSATESGLASSTLVRTSAAFSSADVCGAFGSPTTIVGNPAQNGLTTGCYRYTLTGTDNVGNTVSIQTTVKVDTSDPAAPTLTFGALGGGAYYPGSGTRVYFKPDASNGTFDLTASSSDADTGIASYGFPAGSALGTNWSGSGSGATRTYSYTATATTNGSQNVSATNNAGRSASSSFDPTADSTAPAGGALTVNGTVASSGGSSSYDSDGNFTIGTRTDYTETQSATESGLASSTLVRTSAAFSSADVCGAFGSPTTIVGNPAQNGLTTGCYRYTLTGTDNVGNTVSIQTTVKVDTDGPTVTLADPGTPVAGTVSLTATASDASTGIQQVVFQRSPAGGSTWTTIGTDSASPYSTSWNTGAIADGNYDLRAVATDSAGNSNTDLVASRRVDNTAPDTTIDSSPADPSNNTTPSFAFSSSESGSTFECRIDGGSWTSCSSPHTLAALGAGSHTFDLRATDIAGNTDTTPASYTWTIDLTAPNTTIDSTPPTPDNDSTPTFTFSSTESGSTFECRLDGGSWTLCASPFTVSPALLEGSHTFQVRAIDPAGNTDATPSSYTWILDISSPTVTITAPTTFINSSDLSAYPVTASTPDSDVTHVDFFECSNASAACATGSWVQFGTDSSAPYAATWSTPAFDGPKAIRAVAVDLAANTGQHIRTITIDRTAPSNVSVVYPNGYVVGSYAITTSNGPDSDVNAGSGSLQRQTGDLANDTCSSYGGWVAATSPDTLASGKCARYRYSVADNAANVALATSSNETKSDTSAPTSTLSDPGANLRQTITLSASASDTDGSGISTVAFQRRPAGGGSWTTIAADSTSPYSISFDTTTVTDGLYDFRSVATDAAANAESSPVVVANRRIDNTAPSATMLSPGNPVGGTVALTSNTSDTGGSGIASVAYELAPHSGAFNSQPASWDTTLASDGLYDLRVVATDTAGNSTTSPLITTRVDNTPPALTFATPATGAVVSGTVNLVGSASDASPASPPVTFEYKLHSSPSSAYTATGASWNTTTLPAGDGLYDLRATATDDASNTTKVENTSIRVDNAPPTVSITAPPAAINGSVPSPTTFAANASDGSGSGVAQVQFLECSDQSNNCATGIWSPLGTVPSPGPYSVSWPIPAADGNHALAAVATDNAGHPATAIRNVAVDRTAPSTTILTKPSDPSSVTTPSFTFTSSEPGSTFECRIDGGSFAPCTSPRNLSGLSDNAHTFDVRATDAAGNTDSTPDSWTWHRDTNNPTGTLTSPGANIRQTVTLTSTETDPAANGYASGLKSVSYEYSSDGTTWAPIGTLNSAPFDTILWNTSAVADGVYQLRIVVEDVAGNTTTSSTVPNIRIDNTPPTTSQNDPGQYLRATKTLTASAADSGSGVDHVDFQRAPTGGGSWTTIGTDSTPGDGLQFAFDTTSVPDGHYDLRTVAYDVAGNQSAATPVTDRLVDNTVPTATMNNPGPYLRGAVSLTSATADPGGSNASGVVTVAYEYSTNGGGTWQSTGASFNSSSVPDGNVSLHVVATDAAGNTTTSAAVTSLADNTKPATTDNAPSGWQSSPVSVSLSANDAGSGVNVTEYSVDGNPTYTAGTSVVIPAPANGSNDGAHTIAYFSADNAGNVETIKSTTVLIDATPPSCPSCSAADYLRGTVTLSADPDDTSGSGIKSVAFEYTDAGGSTWTTIGTDTTGPGPYTADWDTTPVADGHYDLRIQITDNADNVTTTSLPDKVVDNTAPNVALVGAPTQGQLVSGTIAITASASDATSPVSSVKFYVRGSLIGTDASAPFSLNWNTTTGPDGAATIQIVVEDMAGNTATSSVRDVSVDNVSPTPTLADPGQYLSGTVSLTASADPDTSQVDFERRPAGGGSWVTIASDTASPWATSLDTTALADGLYDFRAIAIDQTGNSGTSPIRSNVRIDNTAPAGSLTTPANGATVGGTSVLISGSYSDTGSGVGSVRFQLRPTGGGTWTTIATSTSAPFSANWDATTVTSASYDLQPIVVDGAGNTYTGAMRTITVDVTAPTVVLANPGTPLSGSVTLNATVTGLSATQVAFAASPAGGASWTSLGTDTSAPWSTAFDTHQLPDGVYDVRATVSDNLGNTSSDVVTAIRVDNTAPSIVSSTPAEGSTMSSVSAIGLVTSEDATPVGVTLDGNTTVAPVVSGTHIDYGTGALAPGPHTLAGELQDSSGKKTPFRVHFTVWTASTSVAPLVDKNTSAGSATTVDSADHWASATMPSGNWSSSTGDWLILRIAPNAVPAGLTNGFGAGPETVDVTARWALTGTEVHHFNRALGILMPSTDKSLVPATLENGHWRVISRVPSAGTLPTGWDDGFYTDGAGFHLMTKHLSTFGLLRDLEAPNPPQNVHGYFGPNGLTLRWTPGADNSGTYDFVTVYSDSNDTGHFGVDSTAASIGSWSANDSRIFRLKETDLAGNVSSLTEPLRPVPSLVGLTPDQAAALLAPLGLKLGVITTGGTGPAGTISGPAGLVLVEQNSTIDITVSSGSAQTALALKVITAARMRPSVLKNIRARVSLTRAARVTAELISPRRVKLYTWRYSAKAGQSIVKLRLPRQVRRPGVYTLRWTARSGRETAARKITIRFMGRRQKVATPVRVLLAGPAALSVRAKFRARKPKFITVSSIEPTFDAAASRGTNVRVIVVDVNAFGLALVRDLHTVFPGAKIVALTSRPRDMAATRKAGAAVALPRSTPASTLARVIKRLTKTAKPARSH